MAEKKFFDTGNNLTAAAMETLGPVCLTEVTQGTTDFQRVGDKLTMNSLELRFAYFMTGLASGIILRVILFQWFDDTMPAITDVIETAAPTYQLYSGFTHDLKLKRKILMDKLISPITNVVAGPQNTVKIYKKYFNLRRLRNRVINFQGGTVTGINHIYMAIVCRDPSSSLIASPSTLSFIFQSRLNFIDM